MIERPLPLPDDVSAPYWAAARSHELHIQRCESCQRFIHEPQSRCPNCGATALQFERVSGRARVYSLTTLVDPPAPGFADRVPLTIVIAELVEQERLFVTANLIDPTADIAIGDDIVVTFEDVTDATAADGTITLPQFRRAAE